MAKKTYGDKLKHPKWQKRRLEIMSRDNFSCTMCGDTESTLHVHHKEYRKDPWDATDDQLTTWCEDCHTIHHVNPSTSIIKISQKPSANGEFKCIYVYSEHGIGLFRKRLDNGSVDHTLNMSYSTLEFINQNNPINNGEASNMH